MNHIESSEVARLRKELVHSRNTVADLRDELEEKTNLYHTMLGVSRHSGYY